MKTFEEYFPHHVSRHPSSSSRWGLFVGEHIILLGTVVGILRRRPALVARAQLVGNGVAALGHVFVDRNFGATATDTVRHPIWATRADLRMVTMMWRGGDAELQRLADGGAVR